ncbi:MAG: 5-amino-6-(D-ribitylamino)uracil--L-tyrosine 4-hydroxyphenyl transferase CofH [Azonexus sp.]|jgi:FO synthase|nr:5-amino-6-(D-ribitylamino)uracil--L-tyrosine 4-hydroxyphenyl transferase CofH [Azonexus sp.]
MNLHSADGLPDGSRPDAASALALAACDRLETLRQRAAAIRDQGHGSLVTYSPKVFIPLTQLCRNVCHYCTFAKTPTKDAPLYMTPDEVLAIAHAGARAGCHEALFTLGDKPELRYPAARAALRALGHESTLSYLAAMARLVYSETGLLPHINAGVMGADDLRMLRSVSVSQGLMLEATAARLCQPGGPHHGSPDKAPAARLAMIAAAGELKIPLTSGILIGLGETRRERIEALLALRDLADRHGHIQEIIIQNFRRKPGTKMAEAAEPSLADLCWTIAVARIIFGAAANIQAPPNLSPGAVGDLIGAGINDLGGISPVTQDHVNPEAPWPHVRQLERETEQAGKSLVARLPVYPGFLRQLAQWVAPEFQQAVRDRVDADGFPRTDNWSAGASDEPPPLRGFPPVAHLHHFLGSDMFRTVDRAVRGAPLSEAEITRLFTARGGDFRFVCAAADELRVSANGGNVTYVPNRNINYTNICSYHCQFCAFAKGRATEGLRGKGYNLSLDDIQRQTIEAWERGAIEVCLQGGIHPAYTGQTYLDICAAVKAACPAMHIHAFSPLEVSHGAKTLGLSLGDFLTALKAAGLGSLPGTAAEILDDEVRRTLCPDKLTTAAWVDVMRQAHAVGLKSTATIMYGHIEQPQHWARHLLRLRNLQEETGGFTEFVPLPFIHMASPLYRRRLARPGPTFREAVLMHAVGRLVLNPVIRNIQTSWVKMGQKGVLTCLQAGANDLGGTLMNESIGRAAGAQHGQEMTVAELEALVKSIGRVPVQRSTLYAELPRHADDPRRGQRRGEVTDHAIAAP